MQRGLRELLGVQLAARNTIKYYRRKMFRTSYNVYNLTGETKQQFKSKKISETHASEMQLLTSFI